MTKSWKPSYIFWGIEYSKGKNHANPFAGAPTAFISIVVDPALKKASIFLMANHGLFAVSHLRWFIRSWIYHESDLQSIPMYQKIHKLVSVCDSFTTTAEELRVAGSCSLELPLRGLSFSGTTTLFVRNECISSEGLIKQANPRLPPK